MDYGAISYYVNAGDFTGLDSFFAELEQKITFLEHHTATTFELYKLEKISGHEALKSTYDIEMKAASERYDKALDEVLGSDDVKHAYAAHESGWGYLTGKYAMDCEAVDEQFSQMANNLYSTAIISIYILLESELKRLCNCWRELTGHRIALADFGHRDYLAASYKYIDKVMGIDKRELEPHQNKLTDLQNLRNRLIHDGGALAADQLKSVKKLIDSSKKGLVCEPDGGEYSLKITSIDYVNDWYRILRSFFEDLFWRIDHQMNHQFLKARMQYLFGVLNQHISIDTLKVNCDTSKRELSFIVDSNDFDYLYDFEVKLVIKNAPRQQMKITNHVAGNEQVERFVKIVDENQHLFWDRTFKGFMMSGKQKEAQITLG